MLCVQLVLVSSNISSNISSILYSVTILEIDFITRPTCCKIGYHRREVFFKFFVNGAKR